MSLPNDIKPIWEFDKDEYLVKCTTHKLIMFDRKSKGWYRAGYQKNPEYFHRFTYVSSKLHPSHFLYWPLGVDFPSNFFRSLRNDHDIFKGVYVW